jgi:hypothetical protein
VGRHQYYSFLVILYYWYCLITVADTKTRFDFWYRAFKWTDINIMFFSGPLKATDINIKKSV